MMALIACHECDLLHRVQPLPEEGTAKCARCGAVLYRRKRNSLDRSLAMAIAGLILFILCNTQPFMALKREGLVQQTTLITGVQELYRQDMWGLALLVLFTSILAPLIQLSGMLYVLLPLKFNRLPWMLPVIFRIQQKLQPWAMMEVFMLGILVALVKLAKTATVVPGIALYALLALILVLAAAAASLDPGVVWERLEPIHE